MKDVSQFINPRSSGVLEDRSKFGTRKAAETVGLAIGQPLCENKTHFAFKKNAMVPGV